MKISTKAIAATGFAAFLGLASAAQAQTTGFVNNPTTNREDWTTAVTGAGGTVTTNIDFDNPNVGATIFSSTGFGAPTFSAGPLQNNVTSTPLSVGEGANVASNEIISGNGTDFSLLVNFLNPVSAVGLNTIDYFGVPNFANVLTLSAYSGLNGTGTLLGSYTSARFNFQSNNVYFLGLTSTSNNIASFGLTKTGDTSGDSIGVDNIVSGSLRAGSIVAAAPEPGTWAMMIVGFGLAGAALRRRQKVSVKVAYAA